MVGLPSHPSSQFGMPSIPFFRRFCFTGNGVTCPSHPHHVASPCSACSSHRDKVPVAEAGAGKVMGTVDNGASKRPVFSVQLAVSSIGYDRGLGVGRDRDGGGGKKESGVTQIERNQGTWQNSPGWYQEMSGYVYRGVASTPTLSAGFVILKQPFIYFMPFSAS